MSAFDVLRLSHVTMMTMSHERILTCTTVMRDDVAENLSGDSNVVVLPSRHINIYCTVDMSAKILITSRVVMFSAASVCLSLCLSVML